MCNQSNHKKTERTPSLFDKCAGFLRYTTHETNGFTSHPNDAAIMVKCLAQGQMLGHIEGVMRIGTSSNKTY